MKPKKRQKLCYNCEGDVDLDVIVCPFCAADLREEKPERVHLTEDDLNDFSQETGDSLYPSAFPRQVEENPPPSSSHFEEVAKREETSQNVFIPTLFFTLGVQLFLLGLFTFFFSHKGALVLKWDAKFWFFYVLGSIPFLVYGYKKLS